METVIETRRQRMENTVADVKTAIMGTVTATIAERVHGTFRLDREDVFDALELALAGAGEELQKIKEAGE